MFEKNLYRKSKHTFHIQYIFFPKIMPFRDNVEIYCRVGQITNDNMAYAYCMLVTWVYKYRLRICNSYYFRKATMITRTRLNVTSYVHCLYCWYYLRRGWWAKLRQKLLPGDLKQFKLKFKHVLCVNRSFHLVVFELVIMPLPVSCLFPFSSLVSSVAHKIFLTLLWLPISVLFSLWRECFFSERFTAE